MRWLNGIAWRDLVLLAAAVACALWLSGEARRFALTHAREELGFRASPFAFYTPMLSSSTGLSGITVAAVTSTGSMQSRCSSLLKRTGGIHGTYRAAVIVEDASQAVLMPCTSAPTSDASGLSLAPGIAQLLRERRATYLVLDSSGRSLLSFSRDTSDLDDVLHALVPRQQLHNRAGAIERP
jgi:hypothetical protein